MNSCQRKVIDSSLTLLCDTLESSVDSFALDLQEKNIIFQDDRNLLDAKVRNRDKVMCLIEILKPKDDGWNSIISFLNRRNHSTVASKLDDSFLIENERLTSSAPESNFMKEFKKKMADYYLSQYSNVPTVLDRHKRIGKVWVPLQIGDTSESFLPQPSIDHVKMLDRMIEPSSPGVALVVGHPGVGKTTLIKKIAYDWANRDGPFDLVLAVPLRYAEKCEDFLQLTAKYYASVLKLTENDRSQLFGHLRRLGRELLICLDGLDEYKSLAESPLKDIFAAPFERSSSASFKPPFKPQYQLLITSRPYACEKISPDFFTLKFEILPLDELHQTKFVELYCEKVEGKEKVTKYLEDSDKWVINVPLILTFVCYLADLNEEIPKNLTLLYEKLTSHMAQREWTLGKITEKFNLKTWKTMEVVKSTAELAFAGCKNGTYEFDESIQKNYKVTQHSFKCGFLLEKFDVNEESHNAEFHHRSIQEFFAALHSYQLISGFERIERDFVMKEILNKDSQFGRFFFGLCSVEPDTFKKMLKWLKPTFADAKMISFKIPLFLISLSDCLADCSLSKMFGHELVTSLEVAVKQLTIDRNEKIELAWSKFPDQFNKDFQSALKLNFFDGSFSSWAISDEQRFSTLAFVFSGLPRDLYPKFRKIRTFIWRWQINNIPQMINSLDRLPLIFTLVVKTEAAPKIEINFQLEYDIITRTGSTLTNFTFGFDENDIPRMEGQFSDQFDLNDLIIPESSKTGGRVIGGIRWLIVKVKKDFHQHQLIKSLIKLALIHGQEYLKNLDISHNEKLDNSEQFDPSLSERFEENLPRSGIPSEIYSRKVFAAGFPPKMAQNKTQILDYFKRFGKLSIEFKNQKSYGFLVFDTENSVSLLMNECEHEGDQSWFKLVNYNKKVEIRPWKLNDAIWKLNEDTLNLDSTTTVFVGAVPIPMKAVVLAETMDTLFGGVCCCEIATDPIYKYPKHHGLVTFSNRESVVKAIQTRRVFPAEDNYRAKADIAMEVKPYVKTGERCFECNELAHFHDVSCLLYYCYNCWDSTHCTPEQRCHELLNCVDLGIVPNQT